MNKLLAIYAAVLFIAGVIFFTIAQLKIGTSDEPETYRWMRILSIMTIILALVCVLFAVAS
ncbi:MAG: hypothetical protein E7307_03935 [Butyrivibrio sp.]|nr:hypothetical protein [Butyrivibrio sp.]